MNKDWLFVVDNNICSIRTVGVLIRNGKLLVQRDRNGNEFALPGGHIKIGETLADGLVREYKEEIGANISCIKLLWSEECFWEWNGKLAHNFAFYHLIDDNFSIPNTGDFVSHKDNDNVVYGWLPVDELQNVTIYPSFIKDEIFRLDEPMKHFISKG
ncbi:MAG: NUDIX domain-containing protein [Clostridia bacterium]|nr:NUDIX domain-containing protein [Clostridia bacterium]